MNLSFEFLSRLRCWLISSHSSVKTEAGDDAARAAGFPGAFVEVEDSVNAIVTKIDGLTKENGAGEFWNIDGTTIGW